MAKQRYNTEQVIDALKKSRGIVAAAGRILGCDRRTVQNYVDRYPTIKAELDDQRESLIDLAEQELLKKVAAGDLTAVMFLLKTVGKGRGYTERRELDIKGLLGIDLSQLSDEELDSLDRQL